MFRFVLQAPKQCRARHVLHGLPGAVPLPVTIGVSGFGCRYRFHCRFTAINASAVRHWWLIGKHGADLALEVTAVAPQSTDRAQLAGLGPARHSLRVDTERGRHLCGRQKRVYGYGLGAIHFESP